VTRPNRLNVPWPTGGPVRFVGGLPQRHERDAGNVEYVHEGQAVGAPIFSDGAAWIRVHVPGMGDDVLVPVENLRP
jgi:hypothetical protein